MQTETGEKAHAAAAAALGTTELGDRVFRWDLAAILCLTAARNGWRAAYALEVELEYRKFIYVSVKYPGEKLGMCGPVDQLWHDHILHTRDYVEFCRVLSGQYLHHVPTGESSGDASAYQRTLALIEQDFDVVNWNVWPAVGASETDCCSSCNCSDISAPGGTVLLPYGR